MNLELRDLRRGTGDDKYVWMPFEPSDQFTLGWWDRVSYMDDDPHYVGAWLDGRRGRTGRTRTRYRPLFVAPL